LAQGAEEPVTPVLATCVEKALGNQLQSLEKIPRVLSPYLVIVVREPGEGDRVAKNLLLRYDLNEKEM